jgi:putative membrane protein
VSVTLRALCVLTPLVLAIPGFRSQILADWWLENLVVFVFLLALALSWRLTRLSNTSYLLLFLFLCAHEYGALWSYSNVPLGELAKPFLHTDRNHYDRLVNFLFGLLITYPAYEACSALRASADG